MTGEVSKLRDILGQSKKFASEIVEIDGHKFEVRQPTVGARSAILKAAGTKGGSPEDLGRLQVFAVIHCTFDPDTGKNVFGITDAEALSSMPAGSWVDDLSAKAIELMNVEAEKAAKDLSETPADSSSSR